jgi:hypothetical protein
MCVGGFGLGTICSHATLKDIERVTPMPENDKGTKEKRDVSESGHNFYPVNLYSADDTVFVGAHKLLC